MKKLTAMTIVLAILLALTTAVCAAEVKEAKAGETVTLTFNFGTDAEGNTVKLAGYQGYITYNDDELTYVEGSASSTYATDDGAGKIKVSYIGGAVSEVTAKFVLNKDLKAGEVASAELKLDSAALDDESSVTVSPVTDSVKVVAEPTPTQEPTKAPDAILSQEPTKAPDATPSQEPTKEPDQTPSQEPTKEPDQTPTQEPTTPAEPAADGKEEPTSFDKTGISVAYVGIIAAIVIAGAVVLIKRK